jgi:cytochrome c oxidase assembly factor CtaG
MMIPYLVAADLVNTALSAVLSFSGHVLYSTYESVPRVGGLSALDDQALSGVLMWVPGSIAFLLPAVLLTVRLFDARSAIDRQSHSVPAAVRD